MAISFDSQYVESKFCWHNISSSTTYLLKLFWSFKNHRNIKSQNKLKSLPYFKKFTVDWWMLPFSSCDQARSENTWWCVLPKHSLENLSHNFHDSAISHFNTVNLYTVWYILHEFAWLQNRLFYVTYCNRSYSPHLTKKAQKSLSHSCKAYL